MLLYTVLPTALLYGLLTSFLQINLLGRRVAVFNGDRVGVSTQWRVAAEMMSSPLYWLNMALGALFFSLVILSVYGYVLGCLRGPAGGPVTVAEVWAIIRRQLLSTTLSILGIYLLIAVGFIFLFIPGIYLSVMLSLFFIVKMVEGTGFADTVSRCWHLIKGKWWSTFGLLFVMTLLLYAVLFAVGLVTAALAGGMAALVSGASSPLFVVVTSVLTTGLMLFFYPPLLLVLAFQYFNLVERRDGTGLRSLVGQLGQPAPAAPRNASLRADEEGEY